MKIKMNTFNQLFTKKHITVSFKNLLAFSSLIIVFIALSIIGLYSYNSTVHYLNENIEANNISNLIQYNRKLEENLTQIKNITENIANNPIVINNIKSYDITDFTENNQIVKTNISILNKMKHFNELISSFTVFTENYQYNVGYFNNFGNGSFNDIKQSSFYSGISKKLNGALLFEPRIDNNKASIQGTVTDLENNYTFACMIGNNIKLGCIFTKINPVIFQNLFTKDINILLVNKYNDIIWKGDNISKSDMELVKKNIPFKKEAGISKFYSTSSNIFMVESIFNSWKLYYFQKSTDITGKISALKEFFILAFILAIIFSYLFSEILSRKITNPVKGLINSIRRYRINDSNIRLFKNASTPKITLREIVLYYLIVQVIFPSLLYMATANIFTNNIIDNYIIESNKNAFNHVAENINSFIENKQKIIRSTVYDPSVQNTLENRQPHFSQKEIYSAVEQNFQLYNGKDEIYIYNTDKNLIFTNTNPYSRVISNESILSELNNSSNNLSWLDTRKDEYNRLLINIAGKINSIANYNTIGFFQCQIPEYDFENIYKTIIRNENSIFIVNKDNTIISHPDKNKINTKFNFSSSIIRNESFMEDKDSFVFKVHLDNTSWYLIGQYYLTIFDKDRKNFLYEKIYIMIIISISTICIAYLLSYNFTSSINKMNRLLKKLGIDNMDNMFPEDDAISEISELGTTFNEMILRTESLLDQLIISTKKQNELEAKKKDSEMTALQAQINPHFLYNTFESINCLIRDGDRQNAIKMLTSLSGLFRFIARADNVIVPISEELEYVKTYAEIMKMRFGEDLTFQWDINQDLLTCKTIKLILQPIIENAIYHGIKPKQSNGNIRISCINSQEGILFAVSDNGVGMDDDSLNKLIENLNSEKYLNRIGLYNVQNRIRLFFGKQYGLKIESKYGEGTNVEVIIPRME